MSKEFGLGNLFKQAEALQSSVAKIQEEAAKRTVEGKAGGGMVTARVTGKLELIALEIDPQILQSDDVGMLQDLIVAAVNQGLREAQRVMAEEMSKMTGGLKIPGLT